MNLVQVPRGGRLGHELLEALIQRAVVQQIRAVASARRWLLSEGHFRRTAGASKLM